MDAVAQPGPQDALRAVEAAGPADVALVVGLLAHPSARVRSAAVMQLPLLVGHPVPPGVVAAVVALTSDEDPRVRDHACFVLGQQWREVDTPAVREGLAARLDDADQDARDEALLGLAHRQDERALPRVRAALTRPDGSVWLLELLAAGALGDPSLHALVLGHLEGWDEDAAAQLDAVRRLTDPAGPGDDVLDGVAELSRRRAHGRPDGAALAAWTTMAAMLDLAPGRAPALHEQVLARLVEDPAATADARAGALAQQADGHGPADLRARTNDPRRGPARAGP